MQCNLPNIMISTMQWVYLKMRFVIENYLIITTSFWMFKSCRYNECSHICIKNYRDFIYDPFWRSAHYMFIDTHHIILTKGDSDKIYVSGRECLLSSSLCCIFFLSSPLSLIFSQTSFLHQICLMFSFLHCILYTWMSWCIEGTKIN